MSMMWGVSDPRCHPPEAVPDRPDAELRLTMRLRKRNTTG
jgi:hypothetical protein